MRILITGASGFIGFHLLKQLIKNGHSVVGCTRRVRTLQHYLPNVEWIHCDFTQDISPDMWRPRLEGIDVIVNAVGIIEEQGNQTFETVQTLTPIALFDAADSLDIKVIQISALGADDPDVKENFLRTKLDADNHLNTLSIESIIVHPSIVIGRGGTSTALFNCMAALPITPLIGDGQQKIQPIHIDDAITSLVHMIEHWPGGKKRHQLMGANILTMTELYTLTREWLRLPNIRFIKIPLPLLRPLANLNEKIGGKGLLNNGTLNLLENARTPEATYHATPPKPLQDALWLDPATKSDTWYARLQSVHPMMFWSIAFIWIFTGLTSAFFDLDSGYALMASGGFSGWQATTAIYAGAIVDFSLGIMMIKHYRLRWIYSIQITMMLGYMVAIAFIAPDQWLHPFGPVTKNFPLIAGTIFLLFTLPIKGKFYLKAI